ncbi:hypothetical protein MUO69_04315, partial [Candidatus Bathyarchaeota archaeon]|nr:hypothetical protein [Candidatus Bathyarchaeota archaeon]
MVEEKQKSDPEQKLSFYDVQVHVNDGKIKKTLHRKILQFFAIIFVFCICTTTAGASSYINSTNSTADDGNPIVKPDTAYNTSGTRYIPADNGLAGTTGLTDGNETNSTMQPEISPLPQETIIPLPTTVLPEKPVANTTPVPEETPNTTTQSPTQHIIAAVQTANQSALLVPGTPASLMEGSTSDPAGAPQLIPNEVVNGTISNLTEWDPYLIPAEAGDQILLRLRTSWRQYPELRLYAPNGTLIRSVSSYPSSDSVELSALLPNTGTYSLLVGDREGDDTGTYWLYFQETSDPAGALQLIPNEVVNGTISNLTEWDPYLLEGEVGDQILLRVRTSWSRYPELRLYAPNGTLIRSASSYPSSDSVELSTVLPNTGTYSLLVGDREGDDTGDYELSLSLTRLIPLFINQPYNASISQNRWQYYSISVLEDEELLVKIKPSSSTSSLEVYGAYERIPTESDCDFVQKVKNPDGDYDLLIAPTQTGSYTVGIYSKSSSASTDYTITATLGGRYISNIYPRILTNTSRSTLQVYGLGLADGMQIELRNATMSTILANQVILSSPTTLVSFLDLSGERCGLYDLALIWPDHSERVLHSVITVAEKPQGMLDRYPEVNVPAHTTQSYQINVPGGQNLFVTLQKTAGWNGK